MDRLAASEGAFMTAHVANHPDELAARLLDEASRQGRAFLRFREITDALPGIDGPARWRAFDALPAEFQGRTWRALGSECGERNELDRLLMGDAALEEDKATAPADVPPRHTLPGVDRHSDDLREITAHEYIKQLTGRDVGRDNKVCCPFHEERTASLHVGGKNPQAWHCFGCGQGGTIFEFAALLWNWPQPLRGENFTSLSDELCRAFGIANRWVA